MADRKDHGPAFPGFAYTDGRGACRRGAGGEFEYFVGGMSLRDYFAAKAIPTASQNIGPLAWRVGERGEKLDDWLGNLAFAAYAIADAMLAEREKSRG